MNLWRHSVRNKGLDAFEGRSRAFKLQTLAELLIEIEDEIEDLQAEKGRIEHLDRAVKAERS